ncbi:MAG: ABC transporter permease subunit [Actinomycetes bacterium]
MIPARLPRWLRLALLLTPALLVVVVLFLGGFLQAVLQSLGYVPFLSGWHWSTDAYARLAADPAVRASFVLTFRTALLATLIAVVLGVSCALLIASLPRGRRLVSGVFSATLPIPHLVGATCMLLLLSPVGLLSRLGHAVGLVAAPAAMPELTNDGFGLGIILEYVWKETPFIGVVVLAAIGSGLRDLEDVARTLGAGRVARLRHVVIPVVAPAVAAASILVFAFAFGSYEVPYLLGRPFPATLPVLAYQAYTDPDLTQRPEAMAVSVVIAVVIGALVLVYLRVSERYLRGERRPAGAAAASIAAGQAVPE